MSKKIKSQASSSRAAAAGFTGFGGFSTAFSGQGRSPSALTYVAEPPDLSRISEPQLVVAFKNSLKKDEITRTKALDDLRDYISAVESRKGTLDDGFLEAWIKIYPRASIDLSRKVRQLAHSIQGFVAFLAGKRIARHLSKVIGAWLAGLYDNDKPVSRSALESLAQVFPTEEKRKNVWRIYQSSILDFVDDVILQQTPLTLSDERTVKPDDAQAKYARVAGTALSLFNRILVSSSSEDIQKDISVIQTLLGSKSLWSLCYHEDPFVRRSVYGLLRSAASALPEELDWRIISAAVIGKSLSASQIGASSDLSETLLQLTSSRPQLWTEDYSGKSSSSKRLLQYIQKGSQGGLSSFWSSLNRLLQVIPLKVLAQIGQDATAENVSLSSATRLMEAFQDGLNSRDEPRHNRETGWESYVDTGVWLLTLLSEDKKGKFVQERITPLLGQYVRAVPDQSEWTVPPQFAEPVCVHCFVKLATHGHENKLQSFWTELSERLLETVKLSSPEQSKDFRTSQESICAQARRFFALETAALDRLSGHECEAQVVSIFEKTGLLLLENCLQVLHARNGKPYGATAVVEEVVRTIPEVARHSQELLNFLREDAPDLILSASGDRLVAIALSFHDCDGFGPSFKEMVERVLQLEPEQSNIHVLQTFISLIDFTEVPDKTGVNSLVMRALEKPCWPIVIAVLQNPTVSGDLVEFIFSSIVESLSNDDTVRTLHGLSQISSSVPSAVREFQAGPHGPKLTGKLLYLTESTSEEIAGSAEESLKNLKEAAVGDTGAKSSLEILRHNFDHVSDESLSVESLLDVAEDLLQSSKPEEREAIANAILPSRSSWESALNSFLRLPPAASTAITSPLAGIVHLVDRDVADSLQKEWENVPRDISHLSSAFRLAFFTTKILSSSLFKVSELGTDELETLFYNLPLVIQLIEDDLSMENCNGITGLVVPEQRDEYLEVVMEGRKVINHWISSKSPVEVRSGASVSSMMCSFWEDKLEKLEGVSPIDYRVGEAFVKIMTEAASPNGTKSSDDLIKICREARRANTIRLASWFAVWRHSIISSPAGTRLCNELVADSTGLEPEDIRKDGLKKLALLNILLSEDESVVASIPTQRLVFLVKSLIKCLQSDIASVGLQAEIIKILILVFPCLQDIYGSHWEEIMEILSTLWRKANSSDEALPPLASSFRLFARLRSVADGDSNDDLKDAWSAQKARLFKDLASTLSKFDSSIAFYQPRDITVELLCRLIGTVPVRDLENVGELFPLLTVDSRVVQRAAYGILHRYVPSVQEQVSFDVVLSKTAVHLPDELMSLLLEAPTVDSMFTTDNKEKIWTRIRSYLLSWKIVFDHFSNASVPVQEFYVTDIKEYKILEPLLEFIFDFLLKSHDGKLVDASKFDVRSFEPDQSATVEKETQWLLVHLYYLSLRHLANPTKSWWIDTKKRIKGPVESWTEKFISPLVIDDALQSVSEWISTQDSSEERALTLKISPKSAEITASIPVDEESPPVAIGIVLPPAYPLHPALVVSRSRVLVDERKWKGWLATIQGVIMFANGSLVDGLLAFRKNVQGALKGQSECAICYSVISTDMQTPNKRCATCKNTFHSVCLYRWFKSSNQSTCPLCRNNFVYV